MIIILFDLILEIFESLSEWKYQAELILIIYLFLMCLIINAFLINNVGGAWLARVIGVDTLPGPLDLELDVH